MYRSGQNTWVTTFQGSLLEGVHCLAFTMHAAGPVEWIFVVARLTFDPISFSKGSCNESRVHKWWPYYCWIKKVVRFTVLMFMSWGFALNWCLLLVHSVLKGPDIAKSGKVKLLPKNWHASSAAIVHQDHIQYNSAAAHPSLSSSSLINYFTTELRPGSLTESVQHIQ